MSFHQHKIGSRSRALRKRIGNLGNTRSQESTCTGRTKNFLTGGNSIVSIVSGSDCRLRSVEPYLAVRRLGGIRSLKRFAQRDTMNGDDIGKNKHPHSSRKSSGRAIVSLHANAIRHRDGCTATHLRVRRTRAQVRLQDQTWKTASGAIRTKPGHRTAVSRS